MVEVEQNQKTNIETKECEDQDFGSEPIE